MHGYAPFQKSRISFLHLQQILPQFIEIIARWHAEIRLANQNGQVKGSTSDTKSP